MLSTFFFALARAMDERLTHSVIFASSAISWSKAPFLDLGRLVSLESPAYLPFSLSLSFISTQFDEFLYMFCIFVGFLFRFLFEHS